MIKSTTYEDIIKLIRKTIIDYTGVPNDRVMNADSIRGADLSKSILNGSVGINVNDVFMLFELLEDETKTYLVINENKENLSSVIQSYNFNIKIYGNKSSEVSKIISALFHNPTVCEYMYENGVHITGSSAPTAINEFINDTLWMRRDLTIALEARNEISLEKVNNNYIEVVGNVKINK